MEAFGKRRHGRSSPRGQRVSERTELGRNQSACCIRSACSHANFSNQRNHPGEGGSAAARAMTTSPAWAAPNICGAVRLIAAAFGSPGPSAAFLAFLTIRKIG